MNFLAPLAFAFAASIPIVIVFYLLKRKRLTRVVSSTVLWQRFLAETQASHPFQKLRRHWLLLLQILFLLLAVFALARPYFKGTATPSQLKVIVLDGSASMKSTDENPTRFAKAQKQAAEIVNSLLPGEQAVVLLSSSLTVVRQSATMDKHSLLKAIDSAQASDTPTSLFESLKLAETLIQNRSGSEIHLFSDGNGGLVEAFHNSNLPLIYHAVGTRSANLGIVNLSIRPNPENPSARAVFVTVANSFPTAKGTEIQLFFDEKPMDRRAIQVEAGQTASEVFVVPQTREGVFTAKLTERDDLLSDNHAFLFSPMPKPVKALLVSPGNLFLEKALRAVPQVELSTVQTYNGGGQYDLEIFDSSFPQAFVGKNLLLINTLATNWMQSLGSVETPGIADWKGNHPLLRSVALDTVSIAEGIKVVPPDWATPIVESANFPIILAGENANQKMIWIGFDVLKSTWPLRVSFPIFIANAVEWLSPPDTKAEAFMVGAGKPIRAQLSAVASSYNITLPDGTKETLSISPPSDQIVFPKTDNVGVYHLVAGTNSRIATVNLLDAKESNTRPIEKIQLGKYTVAQASMLRVPNVESWRWLLLAGLGALMIEWWYFHRRST